jgi:protein TonB
VITATPPAKPISAVTAAPDAADPISLSLDEDFRSRTPEPRKVTGPLVAFDFDDALAGDLPRPVVIPTPAEPAAPADPAALSIPEEALGFDLATGDSGSISAPAAPEDPRDSRYMDFLLQEDPGTGPPPIDPDTPLRTGPIAVAPGPAATSADDDDIDRVLARVFAPGVSSQGEIPGLDEEPGSILPEPGAPGAPGRSPADPAPDRPVPARPVPEGLRGMDAGTADLLSSLEELENSLPDGGPPSADLRADSTWAVTSGFGELTGQALQEIETSVPYPPPPPPEDERTLQEVLARINMEAQPTAEEIDPSQASSPAHFDALRQTGTQHGVRERTGAAMPGHGTAPTSEDLTQRPHVPDAVAVSSRALFTGALVAVLLLALAAGGWYLFVRESAATVDAQATNPATGSGDPMRFPAAPAPKPGQKKKPKLKPPASGPSSSNVTRPVPGGEKKQRESSRAPAETAPAGANPAPAPAPVAAAPQIARPAPVPAALRANVRGTDSPGSRSSSAADTPMSAADIAPPESAGSAGLPIARANELDAPVLATNRSVPPPTAEAVAGRVGGRAFLNVLVSGDGSVQEVRLMIDPGHGLGEAARRAAQGWRYTAPLREGQPVRVWKTEVVEFERPADEAGDVAESR